MIAVVVPAKGHLVQIRYTGRAPLGAEGLDDRLAQLPLLWAAAAQATQPLCTRGTSVRAIYALSLRVHT